MSATKPRPAIIMDGCSISFDDIAAAARRKAEAKRHEAKGLMQDIPYKRGDEQLSCTATTVESRRTAGHAVAYDALAELFEGDWE